MKNEIIYTENYALIVSDEHIKDVRPFMGKYHLEDGLTINKFPDYLTDLGACKLIIAHRPLTDAPILKGVPLLPEFSEEEDVAELSLKTYPFGNPERNAFITGYNKAKETYKYTKEDLINAFSQGLEEGILCESIRLNDCYGEAERYYKESLDDFIQSLQQTKRPKYFKCETEVECTGNNNNGCFLDSPGHDCGCAWVYPTIINSQGQTELIGKYGDKK
jgi:hypothetical protein